jgi:hypothetical protein
VLPSMYAVTVLPRWLTARHMSPGPVMSHRLA